MEEAFHAGFQLFPKSLHALASEVARRPDDLVLRARYGGGLSRAGQSSRTWKAKLLDQASWWLVHQPGSRIAPLITRLWATRTRGEDGAQIRAAWIAAERSHPQDSAVITGAGLFWMELDPELAGALFRRAVQLDLSTCKHSARSVEIVFRHLQMLGSAATTNTARLIERPPVLPRIAVTQAMTGVADEHLLLLGSACRAALECGELAVARRHANELLAASPSASLHWLVGKARSDAHIVLGRAALSDADVGEAGRHLLDAAREAKTPMSIWFGPNMQLAKELIERGERGVVLEFFDLYESMWETGQPELARWKDMVARGEMPHFGTHLWL